MQFFQYINRTIMKDRIFVRTRKYDYMLPWTLFRSNRKSIQSGKIRNSCQCKLKDFCATNCMSVRRRKSIKKHCIFDGKSSFLTHFGQCRKRKGSRSFFWQNCIKTTMEIFAWGILVGAKMWEAELSAEGLASTLQHYQQQYVPPSCLALMRT